MSLKIVFLDDEPRLCEIFEDNFGTLPGVTIQAFTDPDKALFSINSDPPDIAFFDFRLPKTTGLEVANKIIVNIPIALITGDLTTYSQAPFVKVFSKPFNFEDMEKFIQKYIDLKNLPTTA